MKIEEIYARHLKAVSSGITAHLPRLRALAEGAKTVVEFGVRSGASSSALLLGAERVFSWDIKETRGALELARVAGARWRYTIGDSRVADIPPCEVLFIDSYHVQAQCAAELEAHAWKVSERIAFHDSVTFGERGEDGGPGLMFAVREFLEAHPEWIVERHYLDSHGLLILGRRP